MKTETKRRRQKSRARAPILFPRPTVVTPKPEPPPEPTPTRAPEIAPRPVDLRRVLSTTVTNAKGEERALPRGAFPDYGLEKIPVNTEPHRLTWRGILRQIHFALRAPVGARRSVVRPKKDWTS